MKKLIFITIMLLSTLACASIIDAVYPPTRSGRYVVYVDDLKYSDGTYIKVGNSFMFTAWKDTKWYEYHDILCKIVDINVTNSSYALSLNCTVEESIQFYLSNATYYDLKGYRTNGTLKWSRNEVGSTDIYCYDKSGMSVVKRVNEPYYCK